MIVISVVIYKHTLNNLLATFNSIIEIKTPKKVMIIDNSKENELSKEIISFGFEYIHNPANPGFGAAHNIAIKKSIEMKAKYHLVLNPDVFFDSIILNNALEYLELNPDVGLLMPKVLFPNGNVQYLPKLLPSPFHLFIRKIPLTSYLFKNTMNNYEYRFLKEELPVKVPIVSGCFSLFRVDVLEKIGGYDERFFMYFEDFDISRRAYKIAKNIYLPNIHIYHEYGRGANKSFRLLKIFIRSAIKYFNKWGWLCDADRIKINIEALQNAKRLK